MRTTAPIWLVTIGEPTYTDPARIMRTGMLAQHLTASGISVRWINSTMDHQRRIRRRSVEYCETHHGVDCVFLDSGSYTSTIGLKRLRHHSLLGRRFAEWSAKQPRPAAIISALPTLELADQAMKASRRFNVPGIIDVRDLWPDVLIQAAPAWMRSMASVCVMPLRRTSQRALRNADAIWGISHAYLQWALNMAGRQARPADQVHPIPYCIPLRNEEQIRALDDRHGITGEIIFWFIGTFGRTYDVATMIAAAEHLRRRLPQGWRMVLSGGGDAAENVRDAAARNDRIIATGWIAGDELAAWFHRCDVGLSIYHAHAPQGIPNKMIEYLAAGVPQITTLGGEGSRLLIERDAGYVIPANDPGSLSNQLEQCIRDQATRARKGEAAGAVFAKEYCDRVVCAQMREAVAAMITQSANQSQHQGVL